VKADTSTSAEMTGGEGRTTLLEGAGGVGGVVVASRRASRLNSAVSLTGLSQHSSSRSKFSVGRLGKLEQIFIFGLVCMLLCLWAMVKIFVFFVVWMWLRHGMRGRQHQRN
jgi:hypothetical protein